MLVKFAFLLLHLLPSPLIAPLSSVALVLSLLPRLFVHALHSMATAKPRRTPVVTVEGRPEVPLLWYDDVYKLALPSMGPISYSRAIMLDNDRGYSAKGLSLSPSAAGTAIASGDPQTAVPHSSATMVTLASSSINVRNLLQKFDSFTTGVSLAKRLSLYSPYSRLKSLCSSPSNPVRLCSCVLPVCDVDGVECVVLTRRKARKGAKATFSSMWVSTIVYTETRLPLLPPSPPSLSSPLPPPSSSLTNTKLLQVYPGGHVDCKEEEGAEDPKAAAARECL